MERKYEKPLFLVERFAANECISACGYEFTCDAEPRGYIFQDNDHSGTANAGDVLLNSRGEGFRISFNEYIRCDEKIVVDLDNLKDGVLVSWEAFNRAKSGWSFREQDARTNFKWNVFNSQNSTKVKVYMSGKEIHATTSPVLPNRS